LLQEEKILAQTKDLTAFIKKGESVNRSLAVVDSYRKQEEFFLSVMKEEESTYNLKEINEQFVESGIKDSAPNKLTTIINFWAIKNWIKRRNLEYSRHHVEMEFKIPKDEFKDKLGRRHYLAKLITEYLYKKSIELKPAGDTSEDVLIEFSVQELKENVEKQQGIFNMHISIDDIEDTLFYLSRIESIKIEGGFLVVYNKLSIERLVTDNRIQYKKDDYEKLRLFYQQKVQQIHIVGEYAKKMIQNYKDALQFVSDYFGLNYSSFLLKYFPGARQDEIKRTLTPEKFSKLFGDLSPEQLDIINDSKNKIIVVTAGPGSGKTKVLVHKLASLLLAEDVKHEQMLMLTFSRAAATEFKKRLLELIGNAANFIEIKTFHSYCFDLLGRVGNLSQADLILKRTIDKIRSGDIETNRITKTVLVVDEAQDMNVDEFELIKVLMEQNDDMRVILVGDDDQNIYGFRGSDSKYMQQLSSMAASKKYDLVENYRSKGNIVNFANQWAAEIKNRLKEFPCFAKQQEDGEITIVEYAGQNLIVPISNSISQLKLTGSSCVLTKTNEEAVEIAGLLNQSGKLAKLIQTNDGFSLGNLYEVRYFSELLNSDADSPLINDEDWRNVSRQFNLNLRGSANLELANNIINQFEITNPVKKYKSDWRAFLLESKIEDFVNVESGTIYVSTIHKAKGKEFENVFIMLKNFSPNGDESKRLLYVAFTRAKANLSIHYNDNYLRPLIVRNCSYVNDRSQYSEPKIMSTYLTHRDVQLGYFEFVQRRMRDLKSGGTLTIQEEGLGNASGELILKYSQKFKEALADRKQRGYQLTEACVNDIVYWKDDTKENEVKIVLPRIVLTKE
jgi:ATP-dependent DNA helicase RecQ